MAFDYKKEYERYRKYYQSIEPELKKPANRAYTAIVLSFLVVSLFAWYAIRPTMQTIFTLKREIVDKTVVNSKMEDKISSLIEAQAVYQEIEPDLPLVDQALPESTDAIRAVVQIQSLAQDVHVTISSLSLSSIPLTHATGSAAQRKPTNAPENFPISFSVNGTYTDIKNFILGIDNLRRIMQIQSMTFTPIRISSRISSGSATPTGNQIKLDLKLLVYYMSS